MSDYRSDIQEQGEVTVMKTETRGNVKPIHAVLVSMAMFVLGYIGGGFMSYKLLVGRTVQEQAIPSVAAVGYQSLNSHGSWNTPHTMNQRGQLGGVNQATHSGMLRDISLEHRNNPNFLLERVNQITETFKTPEVSKRIMIGGSTKELKYPACDFTLEFAHEPNKDNKNN